jgi:hypothetical protein
MAEEPRLSEVDKLLKKINLIYTGIKGADPNGILNFKFQLLI